MRLGPSDIRIRIYDSRKDNVPPDVDKAMQDLLDQGDFSGKIGLKYNRRPSPWSSFLREGDYVLLLTAWHKTSNKLLGIGAAVNNMVWINYEETNAVYLFSFRINNEEPSAILFTPKAYKLVMDMFPDSTLYLTTVLEANHQTRRFLEKQRKSMPIYHFITPLVTFCILCKSAGKAAVNWKKAEEVDKPALTAFLRKEGSQIHNFPVFTTDSFKKDNFPVVEDFILIRDNNNKIIACTALWDQLDYKQYTIQSYSLLFSLLRPLSKWIFPLFSLPPLPPRGTQLNFFTSSFLLVKGGSQKVFLSLLQVIKQVGKDYDYFLIASPESGNYYNILERMPGIRYKSRIYQVYPRGTDTGNTERFPLSYLELGRL